MKNHPYSATVLINAHHDMSWLEKTLWSYSCQTYKDFEIIIANSFSLSSEIENLILQFKKESDIALKQIVPSKKLLGSQVLNAAITNSQSNYIIMVEGYCVAKSDFVEQHMALRKENYFLSGGTFKLPKNISAEITKEDILTQNCFNKKWLRSKGLKRFFKTQKLTARGIQAKILNKVVPTNATWNVHNSSGWKKDLLAINGVDERMVNGDQGREMGERLINNGIKSKQIRYSATCLKLSPINSKVTQDAFDLNMKIRIETKKNKKTKTDFGIN